MGKGENGSVNNLSQDHRVGSCGPITQKGYGNMKTVIILLMVVIIGIFTSQQGISGNLTAYQGGKVYKGWVDDNGRLVVINNYGKPIMSGWVNKLGGITITDDRTDDFYQGRVSGFGNCTLNSFKGGNTLRIELER
jgi:hypothetical protein